MKRILIVNVLHMNLTDGAWSRLISRPRRDKKFKSNDDFYYY